MKKTLLIGGAGFIGKSIASRLVESGNNEVTIADNFFRGKRDESIKALEKKHGVEVISADLTEASSYQLFDNNYDEVYMLASIVGVKYTVEIPNELIRINTSLILNTLEWLKKTDVKKVLFSSTSECYAGTIEEFDYKIPTPEEVPLTISDISHPRFTYAVTKMLGESGFLNYSSVFGFGCSIVRFHNVYGPRMGFKHVIPEVVLRFHHGEKDFKIFGYDQTRSFCFIDDAVEGTIGVMESEKSNGRIYHIGNMREEISIEELVRHIGALMAYEGDYVRVDAPSGSVSRRCPDTTRLKEELGIEASVSWKDGVELTVNWYRDYLDSGGEVYE